MKNETPNAKELVLLLVLSSLWGAPPTPLSKSVFKQYRR